MDTIEKLKKQKRNAQDRERRAKQRCSDYIDLLEQKNLVNEELRDKLSVYQGNTYNSYCYNLFIMYMYFVMSSTTYMFRVTSGAI